MESVHLSDRAVIALEGTEARVFLQGLITNDLERLSPGQGLYAALLTPQGKILFDFLIRVFPPWDRAASARWRRCRPICPDRRSIMPCAWSLVCRKEAISAVTGFSHSTPAWTNWAPSPSTRAVISARSSPRG